MFLLIINAVNAIFAFTAEGKGMIVEKINRRGFHSGLFVEVEDGIEIQIPPTAIWDKVHRGDHIIKKKYSFIYQVNQVKYNAIMFMMRSALGTTLFFMFFGLLIYLFGR